jgi:ABC-type branched-subunit amino acid transport system substrate-binding protein
MGSFEGQDKIITYAAPAEIKIGGLFPLTGPLSFGGVEREAAFRMAIEEINEDSSLLPNTNITYLVRDTATDPATGVTAAGELIAWGAVGLIGAASSSVSMAVAGGPALTNKIPQISYSSTNALLSDKVTYPYFLRVVPPDSLQGVALANIVSKFGWDQVATLATSDDYGQGGINVFEDKAKELGISIATSQKFLQGYTNVTTQLRAINDTNVKIIVANFIANDAKTVFLDALDLGMTSENEFVWVGTDGLTQEFVYSGDLDIQKAMQGMIGTRPNIGSGLIYDHFVNMWSNCKGSDASEYAGCGPDGPPNTYATYAYDAVYTYAHAFQALIDAGEDIYDGDILLTQLYKTNFAGATGHISFDANGDRKGVYNILNLQSDKFQAVGNWDEINGMSLTGTIYWDGTSRTDIPNDMEIPTTAESQTTTITQCTCLNYTTTVTVENNVTVENRVTISESNASVTGPLPGLTFSVVIISLTIGFFTRKAKNKDDK